MTKSSTTSEIVLTATIVLPVFNEERNLPNVAAKIHETLNGRDYEIVAVNDGSTDDSAEVLTGLASQYPIDISTFPYNRGIRAVFFEGLRKAVESADDDDVVIIIEADETNDIGLIPVMIRKVEAGADIVIASRWVRGGRYEGFPFYRLALSFFANWLLRVRYMRFGVTDYTIFYRAYRASLVKKFMELADENDFSSRGFAVNAELLLMFMGLTKKIVTIPHVYRYSLKESVSGNALVRSIIETLKLMTRNPVNRIRRKSRLRVETKS